jgi:hypothetical protein
MNLLGIRRSKAKNSAMLAIAQSRAMFFTLIQFSEFWFIYANQRSLRDNDVLKGIDPKRILNSKAVQQTKIPAYTIHGSNPKRNRDSSEFQSFIPNILERKKPTDSIKEKLVISQVMNMHTVIFKNNILASWLYLLPINIMKYTTKNQNDTKGAK